MDGSREPVARQATHGSYVYQKMSDLCCGCNSIFRQPSKHSNTATQSQQRQPLASAISISTKCTCYSYMQNIHSLGGKEKMKGRRGNLATRSRNICSNTKRTNTSPLNELVVWILLAPMAVTPMYMCAAHTCQSKHVFAVHPSHKPRCVDTLIHILRYSPCASDILNGEKSGRLCMGVQRTSCSCFHELGEDERCLPRIRP